MRHKRGIDELELAVSDAATQSERAREKLNTRDEANELVGNVCTVLKGVVQSVPA